MIIGGPDAEAALQRLYPTDVSTIKVGRSRYALLLDERGYVLDDGMICREADGTFSLTFTSGGASMAEMWIRDWTAGWGHDIRLFNQTFALGAINVTGPRATELLVAAGAEPDELPRFLGHGTMVVAGISCKVYRLSFTGEVSYELHHRADRSEELWTALMAAGRRFDVLPHGLEALQRLRLEKGHILVGQDTTDGATPRRIQHQWAVKLDKGDFLGRGAIVRTDRLPLDRLLVGLETEEAAPGEGAVLFDDDRYTGIITSATWSPVLNKGVALAWLDAVDPGAAQPTFPETVTVDGLQAKVVAPHFYDPEGSRARA
jgi:sarcosine oxidase subunit alpha